MVGAVVRLYSHGLLIGELYTRGDGTVEIDEVTPGSYQIVQVNSPQMFSSTPDSVSVVVQAGTTSDVSFGDWGGLHVWLPVLLENASGG